MLKVHSIFWWHNSNCDILNKNTSNNHTTTTTAKAESKNKRSTWVRLWHFKWFSRLWNSIGWHLFGEKLKYHAFYLSIHLSIKSKTSLKTEEQKQRDTKLCTLKNVQSPVTLKQMILSNAKNVQTVDGSGDGGCMDQKFDKKLKYAVWHQFIQLTLCAANGSREKVLCEYIWLWHSVKNNTKHKKTHTHTKSKFNARYVFIPSK